MDHFVNLTPHDIHVLKIDGTMLTIKPSGKISRVQEILDTEPLEIDDVRVFRFNYGDISNLPEPEYNHGIGPGEFTKYYLVSSIVKNAAPWRSDLLVPANFLRDATGNIIGCRNFIR